MYGLYLTLVTFPDIPIRDCQGFDPTFSYNLYCRKSVSGEPSVLEVGAFHSKVRVLPNGTPKAKSISAGMFMGFL